MDLKTGDIIKLDESLTKCLKTSYNYAKLESVTDNSATLTFLNDEEVVNSKVRQPDNLRGKALQFTYYDIYY